MSQARLFKLKDLVSSFSSKGLLYRFYRTVTHYNENRAASLAIAKDKVDLLSQNPQEVKRSFLLSKDLIKEHASRRVDLFVYLLAAYHNTHKTPSLAKTVLQHGRGRKGSAACHSSILPQLEDKTGSNLSILSGTHFANSLNLTSELPRYVNIFDSKIELTHDGRAKAIEILRKVAASKIDPVEGTYEFLCMLQEIFTKMKKESSLNKCFLFNKEFDKETGLAIQNELIELTKEGSFEQAWSMKEQRVNMEYIYMMLRLSESELVSCRSDSAKQRKILQEKLIDIQQEIIQSKVESVKALKK